MILLILIILFIFLSIYILINSNNIDFLNSYYLTSSLKEKNNKLYEEIDVFNLATNCKSKNDFINNLRKMSISSEFKRSVILNSYRLYSDLPEVYSLDKSSFKDFLNTQLIEIDIKVKKYYLILDLIFLIIILGAVL